MRDTIARVYLYGGRVKHMHANRLTYYDGNGVTTGIARRMSSSAGVSVSPERVSQARFASPIQWNYVSRLYRLFQNYGSTKWKGIDNYKREIGILPSEGMKDLALFACDKELIC